MKYALITGATSGIGYELAKRFAEEGYGLILVARSMENLRQTAADIQNTAGLVDTQLIAADLFEKDAASSIYSETQKRGLTVDVLVNNAGQGEWGLFNDTALSRELDVIQLNIVSLVSLTKYFLKEMLARNEGKILLLASSISKVPSPYMAVYAATKSFVLTFAEGLAEEVSGTEVTITALQPDATDTDFFHKAKAENSVVYRESTLDDPREVAVAAYRGMMNKEIVVVPGISNKLQKSMNTLLPDTTIAANMKQQMKPSKKGQGRTAPNHQASQRERTSINLQNNQSHGDYVLAPSTAK